MFTSETTEVKQTASEKFWLFLIAPITDAGFQAPLHKKLGLKLGLFSQKFRAFVNEK